MCVYVCVCVGVDPAEQRAVHRATRLPPPAAVRGEAGEDHPLHD